MFGISDRADVFKWHPNLKRRNTDPAFRSPSALDQVASLISERVEFQLSGKCSRSPGGGGGWSEPPVVRSPGKTGDVDGGIVSRDPA